MSYTYRTPENEIRMVGDILVQRYRILSTQMVVYAAWEQMSGGFGSHQTVATFDGVWYGRIYSRRDDSTFAHLPGGSDERITAVRAHYDSLADEAYTAIVAAFPEAEQGKRTSGDIEICY